MQLISTLLFLLSLLALGGAILFVVLWHRAHNKTTIVQMLREGISHIGISAIVEYPDTPAPLLALLEEEYPRSEAIIVTDLQHYLSPFGELIAQFQLVKVNHAHLAGVRALYRSRHRAFRRVVMVDLPAEHRSHATDIAKQVASYDYVLRLEGESIVAHNTITYCANIIASHHTSSDISLESIVGANALLERSDTPRYGRRLRLRSGKVLAWRKEGLLLTSIALCLPAIIVIIAHFTDNRLILMTAFLSSVAVALFLYISYRVVAEKSLFATFGIILNNFYRFWTKEFKNFNYLYKENGYFNKKSLKRILLFNREKTNRKSL
jgi:hypothetical protein